MLRCICIYIYYVPHLNWCRILFDVFVHLPISYTFLNFLGGIWKYRMIWLCGIFLARGWKIFRWTIWNFGGAGVVPCDSMAWIRRMESKDYLKMLPKRWLSFEKHAGGGYKQVFKNALTQSNWRRSIWSSRSFIQVMQPPLNRKWSPWLWRNLPLDKWILPMLLLQNFVRPLIKLVVRLVPWNSMDPLGSWFVCNPSGRTPKRDPSGWWSQKSYPEPSPFRS